MSSLLAQSSQRATCITIESMASFSQQQRASGRWGSPHRTVVWKEPKKKSSGRQKAVPVVYYLCREDGQLEHPHFMELSISSSDDLCLRDFTQRLDMVRGKGMSGMYSWSSKRSYRNGFVWHDLTDDDIIHPAHADEYVLKGSLRLSASSSIHGHGHGRRRNWSSFDDLAEYKQQQQHVSLLRERDATESELTTDEISPPPSSSSPDDADTLEEKETGLRMRASSMLMQLISCGSIGTAKKSHSHSHHKNTPSSGAIRSDDHDGGAPQEYFSGSVIETNKKKKTTTAAALKRSSSCNDGSRRLQVESKEEEATSNGA